MSVRIHLDNPHAFYTNLDFISGQVILSLSSDENVSAIVVKLEGESKTVLLRPMPEYEQYNRREDRSRVALENHKILYKIEQVFPSVDSGTTKGLAYTLAAGQYSYPFSFKIPFNNGCANLAKGASIGFAGIRLMDLPQQFQYKHVTKTLPPSLTGFPNEAEIRYYVKVTVQRPSIFKENRRSQVGFKFLPIEAPRPPPTNAETFARRPHAFKSGLAPYAKKSSMFRKKPTPLSDTPPSVLVDARLPSPSILTCNEPVPLRILLKKQAESPEYVYLMSLQLELIGYTNVRAQEVSRTETGSWIITSLAGLTMLVSSPGDIVGSECLIDSKLWNQVPLPHTVTPSFDTCNISRRYELEVRVTIGYGHPGEIQPQSQMLPLRFPVEVYSGIAPPAALIEAMASRPSQPPQRPRPSSAITPPTFDPLFPPQLGTPGASVADDAPPSYEDAMADEIGPLDGPRRDYSGITNENAPSDVSDAKVPGYTAREGDTGGNSGRPFPGSGPNSRPGNGRYNG